MARDCLYYFLLRSLLDLVEFSKSLSLRVSSSLLLHFIGVKLMNIIEFQCIVNHFNPTLLSSKKYFIKEFLFSKEMEEVLCVETKRGASELVSHHQTFFWIYVS